ncbi:hypothetical protein GMA19_02727 [Paenibacillus polymyxa E681]|nr:hypothetical protein PPE_05945 [Paenibacillus polymyxa E681]QNV57557.1 hypothetical protein GE561_02727 [Paenibacillus polymyxa E681]QNV62394.1 hypothetical protein GMA19_02727 [Paenibacillus polymyxa E681]
MTLLHSHKDEFALGEMLVSSENKYETEYAKLLALSSYLCQCGSSLLLTGHIFGLDQAVCTGNHRKALLLR